MAKNSSLALPQRAQQVDPEIHEIIFWEEGNPHCVVNKLTEELRAKAMNLPPHLLAQHESELEKYIKDVGTQTIEQIRLSFWDEYTLACDNGTKMRMKAVYARVCSREYFYKAIINDSEAFAYILHPPKDYMLKMRGLLELAQRRLEEILKLPIVNKKGVADTRLIGEIVKIAVLVDNRVKGAVVQKIQVDQTSKNLHLHSGYEAPKDHRQIESELASVQKQIEDLRTGASTGDQPQLVQAFEPFKDDGDVIDVESDKSQPS